MMLSSHTDCSSRQSVHTAASTYNILTHHPFSLNVYFLFSTKSVKPSFLKMIGRTNPVANVTAKVTANAITALPGPLPQNYESALSAKFWKNRTLTFPSAPRGLMTGAVRSVS